MMKEIKVRNLDLKTYNELKKQQEMSGLSMNQLVNNILDEHVKQENLAEYNLEFSDRLSIQDNLLIEIAHNTIEINYKLGVLINLFEHAFDIDWEEKMTKVNKHFYIEKSLVKKMNDIKIAKGLKNNSEVFELLLNNYEIDNGYENMNQQMLRKQKYIDKQLQILIRLVELLLNGTKTKPLSKKIFYLITLKKRKKKLKMKIELNN